MGNLQEVQCINDEDGNDGFSVGAYDVSTIEGKLDAAIAALADLGWNIDFRDEEEE